MLLSLSSTICVLCVVSSMLENETIQGVLGSKPTGLRKRSTSFSEEGAVTMEVLLQRLGLFHTTMSQHGMDSDLIKQVVKQQFYIICAVTLNHLLLRKDMCSWGKGLQIRYSQTHTGHEKQKMVKRVKIKNKNDSLLFIAGKISALSSISIQKSRHKIHGCLSYLNYRYEFQTQDLSPILLSYVTLALYV